MMTGCTSEEAESQRVAKPEVTLRDIIRTKNLIRYYAQHDFPVAPISNSAFPLPAESLPLHNTVLLQQVQLPGKPVMAATKLIPNQWSHDERRRNPLNDVHLVHRHFSRSPGRVEFIIAQRASE
jgi:hypothetical protein